MQLIPILAALLHFQGQAQIWTRTCSGDSCPLPTPLGEAHPIEFDLSVPDQPDQVAVQKTTVQEDAITAQVTTYVHSAYVVVQVKLSRQVEQTNEPLAECNQYHSLSEAIPFVVGVCSGFAPDHTQWGITLSRGAKPQSKAPNDGSSPDRDRFVRR